MNILSNLLELYPYSLSCASLLLNDSSLFPFTNSFAVMHLVYYPIFMFYGRTPEWLKKMFAAVTKSERNGPVFRFFMDLGDAGMK